MNKTLAVAALAEAATGLALMVAPSLVAWLLFGAELPELGVMVGRVTGVAILSLSLACWTDRTCERPALRGMTCYSFLVTAYFGYLGLGGPWVGWLLWPAFAGHLVLTLLLGRSAWRNRSHAPPQ